MKRLLTSMILLIAMSIASYAQTEEQEKQNIDKGVEKALENWMKNPTEMNYVLDPELIKQFKDSGALVNGMKENLWVEFSLDTQFMGQKHNITIGANKLEWTSSAVLQKESGIYSKGKREGVWLLYRSYNKEPPFYWMREYETAYQNGQKNGKETFFTLDDTILIRTFFNGQEHGIGKIFDTNSPHKLQKVYNAIGGNMWLLETYYPSGKLQTKYIDTTYSDKETQYYKEFYENGKLKMSGNFINGSEQFGIWTTYYENEKVKSIEHYDSNKLDGNYKYFHDNGQLWTERIYKNGNLLEVISNYNREGKKNDSGTIKKGTGTVNIYNVDGKLTDKIEYFNGQERKGSR